MEQPHIYRAVAKKMAQLHSTTRAQMPVAEKFGNEIWPWNTKLVKDHLNQEWFKSNGAHSFVWKNLGMNTSLEAEFDFADEKVKDSTAPTSFWLVADY